MDGAEGEDVPRGHIILEHFLNGGDQILDSMAAILTGQDDEQLEGVYLIVHPVGPAVVALGEGLRYFSPPVFLESIVEIGEVLNLPPSGEFDEPFADGPPFDASRDTLADELEAEAYQMRGHPAQDDRLRPILDGGPSEMSNHVGFVSGDHLTLGSSRSGGECGTE